MTKALDSALRLLGRREHSVMELWDKLKQKNFKPDEIQAALDECQRLGLQSDSRFVESYSRSRIRQGYGPLKIIQELKSKGIDPELITDGLEEERDHWVSHALNVWDKKCKGRTDLTFDEIQKQQRFLLYRGFGMDVIALVVKELK